MSTIAAVFSTSEYPCHVSNATQHTRLAASPEASSRVVGQSAGRPAQLRVEVCMDSLVTQLARELSDATAAAVADDTRVEACRETARAAGLEMRVSLEAV